jgi:hypothetical protein
MTMGVLIYILRGLSTINLGQLLYIIVVVTLCFTRVCIQTESNEVERSPTMINVTGTNKKYEAA